MAVNVAGLATAGLDRLTGVPSQWGGMSRALMARLFEVVPYQVEGKSERLYREKDGGASVVAPISDSNLDATFSWQSPFENAGPEQKAPSLMAMIQSGQLGVVISSLQAATGMQVQSGNQQAGTLDQIKAQAQSLEGKTGITKLNSRQVFSGMPPVKITMAMHFRAIQNPISEVVKPYQQLLEWSFPQKLAPDGILTEVLRTTTADGESFIKAMFPSEAPQVIGFSFGGNTYMPMVIEGISNPLDGPIGITGQPLHRTVQLTLATLTALDREDIKQAFKRKGFF